MRVRKMALIAALLAVSTVQPATAAEYQKNGFNNGEVGFVSLTWGLSLTAETDSTDDVADGKVHAECEFYEQGRPSSNDVIVVLEGHAHAEPDGLNRATSVGLECELRLEDDDSVVVASSNASNEGSQYVQAPPTIVASSSDSYTVCTKTTVHWADNTVTENTEFECQDPQ